MWAWKNSPDKESKEGDNKKVRESRIEVREMDDRFLKKALDEASPMGLSASVIRDIRNELARIHSSCPAWRDGYQIVVDCWDFVRAVIMDGRKIAECTNASDLTIYAYKGHPHQYVISRIELRRGYVVWFFAESDRPHGPLYQSFPILNPFDEPPPEIPPSMPEYHP